VVQRDDSSLLNLQPANTGALGRILVVKGERESVPVTFVVLGVRGSSTQSLHWRARNTSGRETLKKGRGESTWDVIQEIPPVRDVLGADLPKKEYQITHRGKAPIASKTLKL